MLGLVGGGAQAAPVESCGAAQRMCKVTADPQQDEQLHMGVPPPDSIWRPDTQSMPSKKWRPSITAYFFLSKIKLSNILQKPLYGKIANEG